MSAICGCVDFRTGHTTPEAAIAPMMAALEPLGRDGGGSWSKGPVALGHRLTHVTPESVGEKLPLEHEPSGCVITADARIDNREELFDALTVSREHRARIADSELILLAYLRWGEQCPEYLLGDFAFAIWDERSQQLFCCRDFIGTKPFYYFSAGRSFFCFATTVEALLRSPLAPQRLDLAYVRSYLQGGSFVHPKRTFWRDLHKLEPARAQLFGRGWNRIWTYWCPDQAPAIRYRKQQDYIDQLRELLAKAVGSRLRSAFAIGSHLSGGLDSSSVSVLAARALRTERKVLHAFCWASPPEPDDYPLRDERAVFETITGTEGMIPHYALLLPDDVAAVDCRDVTIHPTEVLYWELPVLRTAAANDIRVMLSGWGGDEFAAFNGRGYFAALFLQGRWIRLAREVRQKSQLHGTPVSGLIRSRVILPLIPDTVLRALRPDLISDIQISSLPSCLDPGFANALAQTRTLVRPAARERVGVRRSQIALYEYGHLAQRTESWAEHGASHGIEYRYPLMDRRIVEYVLGLPAVLFHQNGWKRHLFRRAVNGLIPPETQWKKLKTDTASFQWMDRIAPAANKRIARTLRERRETIRTAGYLNPERAINNWSAMARSYTCFSTADAADMQWLWLAMIDHPSRSSSPGKG